MKPGPESTGTQRAPEKEEFVSRKLIRPVLPQVEAKHDAPSNGGASAERTPRAERAPRPDRKPFVAEQTFAENFYFQKQLQNKTLLTVVLKNGETINGIVEWYDKNCLKVVRDGGKANLMIYKPAIKYIYKEGEGH